MVLSQINIVLYLATYLEHGFSDKKDVENLLKEFIIRYKKLVLTVITDEKS